ncbi:MAG: nitrite reductase, copper-containing [Alphaproteobacteria bacterium]|nr:nitrite reductase, copper-containing [Alphaproteobacteria bacterium]
MTFNGLRDSGDRANVIAFLKASSAGGVAAKAQEAATTAALPAEQHAAVTYVPDVAFALRTGTSEGRVAFIGVGGGIDGQVNPVLNAMVGDVIQITLINGESGEHNLAFPDQNVTSESVAKAGAGTTISFRAAKVGNFAYLSTLPGQREAGLQGKLVVAEAAPSAAEQVDIAMDPTLVPPPIGPHAPETVRIDFEAVELDGRLADGTTYRYWTFNRKVPGPFLRVRVGDTIDIHMKNDVDSAMIHSVDFHAATGPGSGAVSLQVPPGEEKSIKWKALVLGLYVYHYATPMVAHHIANGMYGMILVEPEGGLPKVSREFYVMQGEIYTEARFGEQGSQEFSVDKMLAEQPEYVVFNGAVGALTKAHPMKAKVGETVRIYFGVGGPNFTSAFHVIGEIFDEAYNLASILSPPTKGVQTIIVPPGGAGIVDFKIDVPGHYILVDRALGRLERGLVGFIIAEGAENREIFDMGNHNPNDAGSH